MTWNYRVCKEEFKRYDEKIHSPEDKFYYAIHEVYYADTDQQKIRFTSVKAITPFGSSVEELKADFLLMEEAFTKPIIDLDKVEYVDSEPESESHQETDEWW